ncbi:MAG: inorganic phosphate transporter [Ignavibacteriales bacterium]|nr:inorganic phosphate transporter [Ignavibacteriales bacterium]
MIWLFISTGLFLGWSLGANHAVNVFGTAVVSRMVKFKVAATVAGIFVILGAVFSGAGASRTLTELGAVNELAGCFTVALAVALAVTWMTGLELPVSTSQAVVGGIVGWNLFTGSPTDMASLSKIVSTWVVCPLLSAIFAYGLYESATFVIRRSRLHILHLDAYTRIGLLVVGAFASYTLGANNIGNVMGMFVAASPFENLDVFHMFSFSGTQQLFLIGGIAIAIGIFTYSYKVMVTVSDQLFKITPLAGLIVVLAESLVLFLFASEGLEAWLIGHGLPSIPLVPLSSTQVVIGAVIGVGFAKRGRGINYRVLGRIAIGWITAPVAACSISFVALFIVQNVFEQKVVHLVPYKITPDVVRALTKEGIPPGPLAKLSGRPFLGSANFRQALRGQQRWTENQLFLIFSYSELDTIRVDSALVPRVFASAPLSAGQAEAVKKLHRRLFVHRWQVVQSLVDSCDEWKPRSGRGTEILNKELKQRRELLFTAFRIQR